MDEDSVKVPFEPGNIQTGSKRMLFKKLSSTYRWKALIEANSNASHYWFIDIVLLL